MSKNSAKTVINSAIGALLGAAIALYAYTQLRAYDVPSDGLAVLFVGILYLAFGLIVLIGTAIPKMGKRFLNVADEAEVRDERAVLLSAAACTSLIGMVLISLVLVSLGLFSASGAIVLIAASLLASLIAHREHRRRDDELAKVIAADAAAGAFSASSAIIVLWSLVAFFGYVSPMSPLALTATIAICVLLGAFSAAGERGALNPQ